MNSLFHDIKQDVHNNCATYAVDGQCLLDRPCPFFSKDVKDGARCSYYENAVLPANDTLTLRYWSRFSSETDNQKVCKRCNNVFNYDDKREQYCNSCKSENEREKAKLRKRKQRRKHGG